MEQTTRGPVVRFVIPIVMVVASFTAGVFVANTVFGFVGNGLRFGIALVAAVPFYILSVYAYRMLFTP
jgi:hypothetical protein